MGSPPAFYGGGAGVGLVNDHEFRAGPQEVKAAAVRFDKVSRDHHEGMGIEDRLVPPQISLKSSGGTGKDQLGMDVEFGNEFLLPLFRQMRRAMLDGSKTVCETCSDCNIIKHRLFPEDDLNDVAERLKKFFED